MTLTLFSYAVVHRIAFEIHYNTKLSKNNIAICIKISSSSARETMIYSFLPHKVIITVKKYNV